MKLLLAALFIFTTNLIFCQQKFIQVTVTDTVLAEPEQYVYTLYLEVQDTEEGADGVRYKNRSVVNKQSVVAQKKFDSLKTALVEKGYKIIPPTVEAKYRIPDSDPGFYSMSVVTNFDSLTILYNMIKNKSPFSGAVFSSSAKDETPYYNKLTKKLIEKARRKAEVIALQTGQTITVIAEVVENKEEHADGGWTAYPSLSVMGQAGMPRRYFDYDVTETTNFIDTSKPVITEYAITGSYTVKFCVQ